MSTELIEAFNQLYADQQILRRDADALLKMCKNLYVALCMLIVINTLIAAFAIAVILYSMKVGIWSF